MKNAFAVFIESLSKDFSKFWIFSIIEGGVVII